MKDENWSKTLGYWMCIGIIGCGLFVFARQGRREAAEMSKVERTKSMKIMSLGLCSGAHHEILSTSSEGDSSDDDVEVSEVASTPSVVDENLPFRGKY